MPARERSRVAEFARSTTLEIRGDLTLNVRGRAPEPDRITKPSVREADIRPSSEKRAGEAKSGMV
jgi:hypothetical protein